MSLCYPSAAAAYSVHGMGRLQQAEKSAVSALQGGDYAGAIVLDVI